MVKWDGVANSSSFARQFYGPELPKWEDEGDESTIHPSATHQPLTPQLRDRATTQDGKSGMNPLLN
jgi:hypothetical protein